MKDSISNYEEESRQRIDGIKKEVWEKEVAEKASNYHIIGAYVAVIFDPIFGITDYFNIPDAWMQIMAIRLSIAAITSFAIYLYRKGKISTYLLVAIPFSLISLQNAYTYLYIGDEQILGHNLNYIALFLGAGLFLFWPIRYSLLAIGLSILATFWGVSSNPGIDLAHFAIEGGLLLLTSAIFTILMIHGKYRLKTQEVKAMLALEQSLTKSQQQRQEIAGNNEMLLEQSEQLSKAKEEIETINEELSRSNKGLEEKVEIRTKLLKDTNREMDQLVYSLSHDFRTPMVNAQGLVILAKSMEPSELIDDLLGKIAECLHRFDELLHDMLNYAVYWDREYKKSEVGINSVLLQVWRDLEHQHGSKMDLGLIGLEEEVYWQTQPEKLRVLLYCILSNAVRFQKKGISSQIEVHYETTGGEAIIRVKDQGQGISSTNLDKVFDMYYRGNKNSTGAGLGLYIARGIVAQIEGQIRIESVEHEWTEVFLTWPIDVVTPRTTAIRNTILS